MSHAVDATGDVEVVEATPEQGRELLDQAARRHLDMSGDEFKRAWAAGDFDDDPHPPGVAETAMLLPFGD